MNRHIILGVDPGTTAAVAAIDLKGSFIGAKSAKEFSLPTAVEYIISLGRPSIIASDVDHQQELPSKLATKFGVRLFTPEKSLTISEKIQITKGYSVSDSHQRDALAAALNAYARYRNKFLKIGDSPAADKIKHHMIQGISISQAKKITSTKTLKASKNIQERQQPTLVNPENAKIHSLEKRIKNLSNIVDEKDKEIISLKRQISKLQRKASERKNPKAIEKSKQSLKSKIASLQDKASLLDRLLSDEIILVGVYPNSPFGFTIVDELPHDIGAIKVAFTNKPKILSHLIENGIEAYDAKELEFPHGIPTISPWKINKLRSKKPEITKIIKDYRERTK
jgi:uncharacterized protein